MTDVLLVLAQSSPVVLGFIGAIVVGVVKLEQHPGPARLVILASLLGLVLSVISTGIWALVVLQVIEGATLMFRGVYIGVQVVGTVTWGLLLAAVLTGRLDGR